MSTYAERREDARRDALERHYGEQPCWNPTCANNPLARGHDLTLCGFCEDRELEDDSEDEAPVLKIAYQSDLDTEWAAALRSRTLAELQAKVRPFDAVCGDAVDLITDWSVQDFRAFRKASATERRGEYSGDDNVARFGAVWMPEVMLAVSVIAALYKVPWGTAFIRAREFRWLRRSTGNRYRITDEFRAALSKALGEEEEDA